MEHDFWLSSSGAYPSQTDSSVIEFRFTTTETRPKNEKNNKKKFHIIHGIRTESNYFKNVCWWCYCCDTLLLAIQRSVCYLVYQISRNFFFFAHFVVGFNDDDSWQIVIRQFVVRFFAFDLNLFRICLLEQKAFFPVPLVFEIMNLYMHIACTTCFLCDFANVFMATAKPYVSICYVNI